MANEIVKFDPAKPVQAAGGLPAFAGWLKSRQGSLGQVAASMMSPERTVKVLLNNFDKNPSLYKCTGNSIWRAVMGAVELGLEPGGALGLAHLVPYGTDCQLIVDYKGLETLAYRSGMVKSITSACVYEGDRFAFSKGLTPTLEHTPCGEDDPNKITHAYCVVKLQNGGDVFEVLTRKQIERLRGFGRGGQVWTTHYEAMARKTVIRQTLKHCPKSTEVQKALALDDRNDIASSEPIFDFEMAMDTIEGEYTETTAKHGNAAVKARIGNDDDVLPIDMDAAIAEAGGK